MATTPVYTQLLWRGYNAGSGFQTFTNTGPPAGIRWVVRDIVLQSGSIGGVPRTGLGIYDSHNATVFRAQFGMDGGGYYHWDGRQVWDVGDTWSFFSFDPGDSMRMTGYALTLP